MRVPLLDRLAYIRHSFLIVGTTQHHFSQHYVRKLLHDILQIGDGPTDIFLIGARRTCWTSEKNIISARFFRLQSSRTEN
jgi:hypothetical protein